MSVFVIIAGIAATLAAILGILALLLARKRSRYSHLPSPPLASFWLGHAPIIMAKAKEGKHYSAVMLDFSEKHGRVFVIWLAHIAEVVVCENRAARQILQDRSNLKPLRIYRTAKYTYGYRFLGNFQEGLNDWTLWSRRHKLGSAFLSKSHVRESLVKQFNQVLEKFLAYIDKATKREEFLVMGNAFHLLTTTVYYVTALGQDVETLEEVKPLYTACDQAMACVFEQLENPLSEYIPFLYRDVWNRAKKYCGLARKTMVDLIKKRQTKILEGEDYENDFLSNVLKATATTGEYNLEDIVDIVLDYFIASYKTMSLALTYALREILRNPEVMKRVVKEVDQVLGDRQFVSPTDLQSFHYLIGVWKESLRRNPPIFTINRELKSDITANGHKIPAGTWVDVSVYVMHLNDEYWPDPFVFNPERFTALAGDASGLPYFPFGTGPRSCMGISFSDQMGRIVLARLFQTFHIQLEQSNANHDEYDINSALLTPKNPVKCSFQKRMKSDHTAHELIE